jgi:hypothetical protein
MFYWNVVDECFGFFWSKLWSERWCGEGRKGGRGKMGDYDGFAEK